MAVWYDFYQTSGGAISRTSEERASEWYHTNTSLIKSYHKCHSCDYLFIIYHNTRTNRNFVHTYHSHIYYTSTYCHFLTLQIAVWLSCQTQQAIQNIKKKKKYGKKIPKNNLKQIISKNYLKKKKSNCFFFFFGSKTKFNQNKCSKFLPP